jgi:hypothetical protein
MPVRGEAVWLAIRRLTAALKLTATREPAFRPPTGLPTAPRPHPLMAHAMTVNVDHLSSPTASLTDYG